MSKTKQQQQTQDNRTPNITKKYICQDTKTSICQKTKISTKTKDV